MNSLDPELDFSVFRLNNPGDGEKTAGSRKEA